MTRALAVICNGATVTAGEPINHIKVSIKNTGDEVIPSMYIECELQNQTPHSSGWIDLSPQITANITFYENFIVPSMWLGAKICIVTIWTDDSKADIITQEICPSLLMVEQPGPDYGTITGRVTDSSTGNPIQGATIIIEGTGWTLYTDANGDFIGYNIEYGNYTLTASASGYEDWGCSFTLDSPTGGCDIALTPIPTAIIHLWVIDSITYNPINFAVASYDVLFSCQTGSLGEDGYCRIDNIPVGTYNVLVSALFYQELTDTITLTAGDNYHYWYLTPI